MALLKSRENPEGMELTDILSTLLDEVKAMTSGLSGSLNEESIDPAKLDVSNAVLAGNEAIQMALDNAHSVAKENAAAIEAYQPKNVARPRIGPGSEAGPLPE